MQELMVGDEAKKHSHCHKKVRVSYPVDNNGTVRNWKDMKDLWDYTFGETKLNIDPRTCKVSYIMYIVFIDDNFMSSSSSLKDRQFWFNF